MKLAHAPRFMRAPLSCGTSPRLADRGHLPSPALRRCRKFLGLAHACRTSALALGAICLAAMAVSLTPQPAAAQHAAAPEPAAPRPEVEELKRFEFSQVEMGVRFVLVFYAADEQAAQTAAKAAFDRIHELNGILSDYDPESELSRLSATAGSGQAVKVSQPLWYVLEHARQFSEKSGGAFDVTVGRIVKLWRFARRAKRMPPADELAAALATKDYRKVVLDPEQRTVQLLVPGTQLDLGAIAKGYATDEALAVLRRHGITRAYVDGGGDLTLGEPPPGRRGWRIGVAPLDEEKTKPSEYLELANCGVATSGDAFQHVTLNGTRYSHIVDPATGLGLTDRSSVTVIAPNGMTADALASAICVLGPERGLKLADESPGVSAYIVRQEDGRVVTYASQRWAQNRAADAP